MICSSVTVCVKNVVRCVSLRRQMINRIFNVNFQAPSDLCFLSISNRHSQLNCTIMPASRRNSCASLVGSRALQDCCFGPSFSKNIKGKFLTVRSIHNRSSSSTHIDFSLGSKKLNLRLGAPRQVRICWPQCIIAATLSVGLLICYSSSNPVYSKAPDGTGEKGENADSLSFSGSHKKKVYIDYSVIGIPGDGRCLFRSIAYGACLRTGKPAPDESLQGHLADALRSRVADEFVKRRKETEWFIEGDFDTYVSQIRKPQVWGGEPELLMASHVLQMPITVFIHDKDAGGLISIAEYGQEYGKDNPIKVLYDGFAHYDALQIPGKSNKKSRL